MSIYGQKLTSEEMAERNTLDRQVVQEIMNLGAVTDDQIWHIVYLLSLEMDDTDAMKKLSAFVRENRPKAFLSSVEE
jgi:hypothetical protein